MKSALRTPHSALRPWLARAAATLALSCAFAAEPAIDPAALDNAFARLPQIEYGQDRAPLAPLDKAIAASHGNETLRKDLEKRCIGVLQGKATAAGKDYACRALKVIGTADSVPALAALLPEAELSGSARYALESMPSPAVDPALRDALPKLNGKLKVGVISSLGVRRDRQAIEPLSGLLKDADAAVAGAAALALGKIATPEAARALASFRAGAPVTLLATVNQAYLEAASNLLRQGERDAAAKIFEELFRQNASGSLHLAGFQGLVAARLNEASTRLVDALSGGDGQMRNLAARLISELPGRETPRVFLEALSKLPADGQAALLNALRARGDASARPAVLSLLQSQNANVRIAVVDALAAIGNASDIATLARLAATAQGQEKEAARKSLANLPGPDVTPSIVAALIKAEAPVRVALLRSLADRSASAAAGAVLTYVADADDSVSRAAANVLGAIADEQQVPALVRHLSAAKSEQKRESITGALVSICSRVHEKAADSLLAGLQGSDAASRAALLRVLGNAGGTKALVAARMATQDADAQVRDAAIRALADWPDAAAAPDLLQIIRTVGNDSQRVLAFRGYIRLSRDAEGLAEVKLKMLADAMDLAKSPDDKKLVLGALGDVHTLDSLRLVTRSLSDAELADEAGAAVVKIASVLDEKQQADAAAALQQVLKSAKAKTILDDARRQLRRLNPKPQ